MTDTREAMQAAIEALRIGRDAAAAEAALDAVDALLASKETK